MVVASPVHSRAQAVLARQPIARSAEPVERQPLPAVRRVGFVIPVLQSAGVERWLMTLIEQLAGANRVQLGGVFYAGGMPPHATTVARLSRSAPVVSIKRHDLPTIALGDERQVLRAASRSCDVLVCWSLHDWSWRQTFGGRVVGISHGCGDWWMQEAARYVDRWVAVSRLAAAPCPVPVLDVTILRNGVDFHSWQYAGSQADARRRLGLPLDGKLIVCVARYSSEKRQELLIEAMRYLPADWRLALVGYGSRGPELTRAARAIGDRVTLTSAAQSSAPWYAAADCTALVSAHEGYGLVLAESLCAGRPAVATSTGIVPELPEILGEQHCQVVTSTDPLAVAEALRAGVESFEHADYWRDVARLARERLSAERMGRDWLEYLGSLT